MSELQVTRCDCFGFLMLCVIHFLSLAKITMYCIVTPKTCLLKNLVRVQRIQHIQIVSSALIDILAIATTGDS